MAAPDADTSPEHGGPLPDRLREPPQPIAPPPVLPSAQLLPFELLRWDDFERLCLHVAERIDDLDDPKLYGSPGQAQHGIDFYGHLPTGKLRVYQVKKVQQADGNLVTQAIAKFLSDRRPFNADSFVLCIAPSERSTGVIDALEVARAANPDYHFDVYGQERLSKKLQRYPDLVEKFFGSAWRDTFCGPQAAQATGAPSLSADALLRGPLRHLDLEVTVHRAETISDPRGAAHLYSEVAAKLANAGFGSHDRSMRYRQADQLVAAGDIDAACSIWLKIERDSLNSYGRQAPTAIMGLRTHARNGAPSIQAEWQLLEGMDAWYDDPRHGISRFKQALNSIGSEVTPLAGEVAAQLANALLVDEEDEAFSALQPRLHQYSGQASEDTSVLLRLATADSTGDWDALRRDADQGAIGPANQGLVLSRYGRWLAMHGKSEWAIDSYRNAIKALSAAQLPGDVGEAFKAAWELELQFGPLEVEEVLKKSELVSDLGETLPRLASGRNSEAAISVALVSKQVHGAVRASRRMLWEARVSGHLDRELRAKKRLGEAYALAGEHKVAIYHLVLAGEGDRAAELAASLSTVYLPGFLEHALPQVCAAALRVVAAQGDMIPPDVVDGLAPTLIQLSHGIHQSSSGDQVGASAIGALTAVAFQLSIERTVEHLDYLEMLIDRMPGTYRPSDEAMVAFFDRAYTAHSTLRPRTSALLLRCLTLDGPAAVAHYYLSKIAKTDTDIRDKLIQIADEGNQRAIEILALLRVPTPAVIGEAERRAARVLATTPDPDRTSVPIGTGHIASAVLAAVLPPEKQEQLARYLAMLAVDVSDVEINRASALNGICYLAPELDGNARSDILAQICKLADPNTPLSRFDQTFRASSSPLSNARMSIGVGELHRAAILLVCHLVTTEQQFRTIEPLLYRLLQSTDEQDVTAATMSFTALTNSVRPVLDPAQLAFHQSPHLRKVAVWQWVRDMELSYVLAAQFVNDPDTSVRQILAQQLDTIFIKNRSMFEAMRDRLVADPSALVRLEAQNSLSRLAQAEPI